MSCSPCHVHVPSFHPRHLSNLCKPQISVLCPKYCLTVHFLLLFPILLFTSLYSSGGFLLHGVCLEAERTWESRREGVTLCLIHRLEEPELQLKAYLPLGCQLHGQMSFSRSLEKEAVQLYWGWVLQAQVCWSNSSLPARVRSPYLLFERVCCHHLSFTGSCVPQNYLWSLAES